MHFEDVRAYSINMIVHLVELLPGLAVQAPLEADRGAVHQEPAC